MKYYKFEKIQKGDNPIIRITYKTWYGKLIVRDVCKCDSFDFMWTFMDNDKPVLDRSPIVTFHKNNLDVYYVNGSLK